MNLFGEQEKEEVWEESGNKVDMETAMRPKRPLFIIDETVASGYRISWVTE